MEPLKVEGWSRCASSRRYDGRLNEERRITVVSTSLRAVMALADDEATAQGW
jgi:hypothetical protein